MAEERPRRGREIGEKLGALLTSGSPLGVVVGRTIGKALEGRGDYLRDAISFHPLPPEPDTKIDVQVITETFDRISQALDGLFGSSKKLNPKRTQKTKARKPRKK